jgi:1-acyl-sn-glycerol-3-phosphate acyltransferase
MARFVLIRHGIPGIKYSQSNTSNEDFSRPAVIICNHQSHLDLVPLLAASEKIIVLTADWVWNNPVYKYAIRNAEFLPASSGVENILPQLKSLVSRGYSIAVYPEGTRSLDCSIGRFHQGAFYLAQTLDVDVLPLILYGSGHALPKHGRLMKRWPIHMEIDQRISPESMVEMGETLREQASSMRKYYKERYAQIANRIEQYV